MKPSLTAVISVLAAMLATAALAAEPNLPARVVQGAYEIDFVAGRAAGKAAEDTFLLMGPTGSGAPYIGDFEAQSKSLDPLTANGWSSLDFTQPTETHWQLSAYQQVGGDQAAWCGDIAFPACAPTDSVGGYGNNWHDIIEFVATVGNPAVGTTVQLTFDLQHWSEPGYDYTWLSRKVDGQLGYEDAASWDGQGTDSGPYLFTYLPGEYLNTDEVRVMFRFTSDGGASDEDCFYGLSFTAGACQVDNIAVAVTNDGVVQNFSDDFEAGWGNWAVTFPPGVGDFTKIWEGLEDADPCNTNYTRQVAWVDDGIVVPGTGGTECINWCYGPSGYLVNHSGGLAGPNAHLENFAVSPAMVWPDQAHDGMLVWSTVYRHQSGGFLGGSTGVYYQWRIRSADTDLGETLETAPWSSSFVSNGGPEYLRTVFDWTAALSPGRDLVQVACGVFEIGWAFGLDGDDGTPAPYFDNFRVQTFPVIGPAISVDERHLAQDNFPEIAAIDVGDLSRNSVRFDMARNISTPSTGRNDPGDSVTITAIAMRAGAELAGPAEMHWILDANPLFDGVRSASAPNPVVGVEFSSTGRFAFDLPDTGFLFPGDRLQYYFAATDHVGGSDFQTATYPADVSGFGDFTPLAYDSRFQMRALPTVRSIGGGTYSSPRLLIWNDFYVRGGEKDLFRIFERAQYEMGWDYDYYMTVRPDAGLGNGLGGRAQLDHLDAYDILVIEHGDLEHDLLSVGDPNRDAGDDVGLIDAWLDLGFKDMFIAGDGLASDLNDGGPVAQAFLETKIGVQLLVPRIFEYINGQATPVVRAAPYSSGSQPVFWHLLEWKAYGGCPGINSFDGVQVLGGALRLAEFTDPSFNTGAYNYSAATLNAIGTPGGESRVISMPYGFLSLVDVDHIPNAFPSARCEVLSSILSYFGRFPLNCEFSAVPGPPARTFTVNHHPNPFNPVTTISYTVAQPGPMTLKVFNIRGELVRTLIDGHVDADGQVVWDGADDGGGSAASGVYFYEARSGGQTKVAKMALIK